jgi:hypothetical protein
MLFQYIHGHFNILWTIVTKTICTEWLSIKNFLKLLCLEFLYTNSYILFHIHNIFYTLLNIIKYFLCPLEQWHCVCNLFNTHKYGWECRKKIVILYIIDFELPWFYFYCSHVISTTRACPVSLCPTYHMTNFSHTTLHEWNQNNYIVQVVVIEHTWLDTPAHSF